MTKQRLLQFARLIKCISEVNTDKGLLVTDAEMAVGVEVFQTGEDGNLAPAADGEYETEKQVITIESGIVKAIVEKQTEITEEEIVEEEIVEEVVEEEKLEEEKQPAEDEKEEEVEEQTEPDEKDAKIAELEAKIEELVKENEELKKKLEEPVEEPIEEQFSKAEKREAVKKAKLDALAAAFKNR